jgi:hypothetical protein
MLQSQQCSEADDGRVQKFRIHPVHDKAECGVQRAFIYMDGNSLSRTEQTEEEM